MNRMDDLISRRAAIDAMCDNCDTVNADCPHYPCSRYLAVEELPSAQQWISCSERYPDMDERVLVYTVVNDYHVWDCMSNRADNYFWEDEDGLYHDKYEVDAWMPLPEPYKEERKEDEGFN